MIIKDANRIPEQELLDCLILLGCLVQYRCQSSEGLIRKGFQVKELTGGIAAWQAMNFPVSALAQDGRVTDNCGC